MKNITMNFKMDKASLKQLSEQKHELVQAIADGKLTDQMHGIVHLIDSFQDQVVSGGYFSEGIVFPRS